MHQLKRSVNRFQLISKSLNKNQWRCSSTAAESVSEEKIDIPNYIPRSPTSILRALSQTVGFDPTAAHFKYHDDPYLIPMSNVGKRSFALALESGRKSAKWIRQKHINLFRVRFN